MTNKLNESLSVRDGRLFIEDCDVSELADRFGTPLFVVSENHLARNLRQYQQAFDAQWPEGRVRIMAAIKANPVTAIRKILTREGAGCDTFGRGELELALRGGVPPGDIAVNGSIKGRDIIRKAIELDIPVVIDNPTELGYCEEEGASLGKRARILLRLKPYLEDLDEPSDFFPARTIREMTQTVKYGLTHTELKAMLPQVAQARWCELAGVHTHAGRHSKKDSFWVSMMQNYVKLIKLVADAVGNNWTPGIVSVGGGFAAEHDRESRVAVTNYTTPLPEHYAKLLTSAFRDAMTAAGLSTQGIVFEIEPGRALHNETAIHLARVHNIKHERDTIERSWVETDTSECFLSMGSLNIECPFDFVLANKADAAATEVYDLVGITCNYECLAEQASMAEAEPGDVISFLNTGSYIETYACNFNALPRPGMVLVNGSQAAWIKRPETQEEVFARDENPSWLDGASESK